MSFVEKSPTYDLTFSFALSVEAFGIDFTVKNHNCFLGRMKIAEGANFNVITFQRSCTEEQHCNCVITRGHEGTSKSCSSCDKLVVGCQAL